MGHSMSMNEFVFTYIYENNLWGGRKSVSGTGSTLRETGSIRRAIPELIKEFNIRSLLDAPCGDFYWMKKLDLNLKYIGVDIVRDLILINRKKNGKRGRVFLKLDLTRGRLPYADLILCRDCLTHLPFKDIHSTIRNFKRSNAKFLLTTTYIKVSKNVDIEASAWRPINLQLRPFNFPMPIKIIKEDTIDYSDKIPMKCLGLWRL